MAKDNYDEIRWKIRSRTPFKGNSARGVFEGEDYVIYSYATIIAKVDKNGQVIYFNDKKYSSTTSRLQNMIKRAYGLK